MRTKVKICGITRAEDALLASELGADAVGLVFADSPRQVDPQAAAAIAGAMPPLVCRVGLFVNATRDHIMRLADSVPLDAVQLHGDESPEFCRSLKPLPVIKAIRVGSPQDLGKVSDYAGVQAILLDSKAGSSRGGTGILFPWDWLFNWRSPKPLFLAGGLRPDNVGEAIRTVRPYAVDVSSGVERSPGIKEASKLRRFMEEVSRAWNEA